MLRRALTPLAVGTLVFLAGCLSDNLTRSTDGPMYAVSDGAHHGNPDFFFLPPLFNNPSKDPNYEPAAFNGTLRPAVEICELGAPASDGSRECIAGPLVKRFAPGTVNVSLADQQYLANWNTTESALNVNKFYRISVVVGTTQLGFADVDPVSNGTQLKNVQTGEFIGLVDGRTLPIKFRIENGALCGTDGTACAAKTINLTQGGGVELVVPGEDFHFDIPPGTQGTAGGQVVTEVTFNLETCEGIDVDLPKFGQCLRVTALYDAPGAVLTLNNPALISMCSFVAVSEGQQELITLHQQDGDLIRALPHAHPNCNVIGAATAESNNLVARSWHKIRDIATAVLMPTPLHAGTRTAMLHLGGGGETTKFGADCTPPQSAMALSTCTPASAQLTPFPQAGHTISDFQFALPAKMAYVNPDDASRSAPTGTSLPTAVKVTDWNDEPVQGAVITFTQTTIGDPNIFVATSNADGIAQVSWTIAAGPNALLATGRGVAAQNNYPGGTVKPFMPDIFSGAPQTPVVVGTGAVPFLAIGTETPLLLRPVTTGFGQQTGNANVTLPLTAPSGISMQSNTTIQLELSPSIGVTSWSSSSVAAATVSASGLLTAVLENDDPAVAHEATITATGSGVSGSIKVSSYAFDHFRRFTTLVWRPVVGAATYDVVVEFGNGCTTGTAVCTTWTQSFSQTMSNVGFVFEFVGAQPGRWHVVARDATGAIISTSELVYFAYNI
jgi:hypothetical protein